MLLIDRTQSLLRICQQLQAFFPIQGEYMNSSSQVQEIGSSIPWTEHIKTLLRNLVSSTPTHTHRHTAICYRWRHCSSQLHRFLQRTPELRAEAATPESSPWDTEQSSKHFLSRSFINWLWRDHCPSLRMPLFEGNVLLARWTSMLLFLAGQPLSITVFPTIKSKSFRVKRTMFHQIAT